MSAIGETVGVDGIEGQIVMENSRSYVIRTEVGKIDQNVFVAKDAVADQLEANS